MNCKHVVNLISKDRLNSAEQITLNTHLEKCLSCKKKFLFLQKTLYLLKNEVVLPKNDFTNKVMSRIELIDSESREVLPTGYFPIFSGYLKRLVPATIMASVILLGLIFLLKRKPSEVFVTFKISVPGAQTVTLTGDFNSWDTESLKLKKQNGFWEIKISLPHGRYQYAFVVDGENWFPDPMAKDYIESGYGTRNSVIDTTKL